RHEREAAHHAAHLVVFAGRVQAHLQPGRPGQAGGRLGGNDGQLGLHAAIISRPTTRGEWGRTARARSSTVRRWPRMRSIDVTPPSVMPHGTMPVNGASDSLVTFSANPCVVTQRARWMPIAAILSLPTQTDVTRSLRGERSARMPKPASVSIRTC